MLLDLDQDLVLSFVTDLASGLYDYDEIADRYGFGDVVELYKFLGNNEGIKKLYQKHRAAYESDDAVEKRIRLKAGLAVEELIPQIARMVAQPTTPTGQKIDGFHKLMRAAGTDGAVAQAGKWGDGQGTGGPLLNLSIVFSNGEQVSVTGAVSPPPPTIEHEDSGEDQ